MNVSKGVSILLQQLSFTGTTVALQCYNCTNIADTDECVTITECLAGQSCYMDLKTTGQTRTMGCTNNQQCGVTGSVAGSLVGRDLKERQTPDCHECCSTDKCNKNLCAHLKPAACIDDVKVDCALMNTLFNICKDIHHAKLVCPNFCSLCSLVDGSWGRWSTWSACDVTCANGTQTRSRTCNDPVPSNGGLDCVGSNTDTKPCLKQLCPAPTIVFKAKGVTDRSPSAGQTIVFGTTLVNEGHAYNSSTGIFIAPVNGTYSFSTQLCTYTQKLVYISIIVDGVTFATMFVYNPDAYSCNTADTVAVLHAQSKVWVKCTGSSSGTPIHEASDFMNSFSGYLVHR